MGINAVIAYHLGAREEEQADRAATHSLVLSVLHGLLLMVVCIAMMPAFLSLFTPSEAVVELGVQYSTVAFSFSVIIMLGLTFEKIFQATGDMKVPMISLMCGCVANIVLDPLMIFGLGPFPRHGHPRGGPGHRPGPEPLSGHLSGHLPAPLHGRAHPAPAICGCGGRCVCVCTPSASRPF